MFENMPALFNSDTSVLARLEAIEKNTASHARTSRLRLVVALIGCIAAIAALVIVLTGLGDITSTLVPQISDIATDVETLMQHLSAVDVEGLTDELQTTLRSVEGLAGTASESMETVVTDMQETMEVLVVDLQVALEKLQQLDIESLNESIESLNSVVSSLSKLLAFLN